MFNFLRVSKSRTDHFLTGVFSHLGGIFGFVFFSGRGEEVRGEFARFAHMALNLHFSLHECNLGVQLSKADLLEIGVCHGESSISLGRFSLLALALSVLEVNLVDKGRLGALFGGDLEAEHSVDLGDQSLAQALPQILGHHVEDALRFETGGGFLGSGLGSTSRSSPRLLLLLKIVHDDGHEVLVAFRVHGSSLKLVHLRPLVSDSLRGQCIDVKLHTRTLLPSLFGDVASTNFVKGAGFFALVRGQPSGEGSYIVGLQSFDDLLRHHSFCHARSSERRNAIHANVALETLLGERLCETPKAKFGRRVVDLSERAEDSSGGARVHNSAVVFLTHDVPGGTSYRKGSLQVDQHDQVPIEVAHLLERDVSQDSRIVDHNVNSAESVNCSLHNFVTKLDRVFVCDSNTTRSLNFVNHSVGGVFLGGLVFALDRAAEIVDYDLGTSRGQKEGILATQTVSCTGNNGHLSVKANVVAHIRLFTS